MRDLNTFLDLVCVDFELADLGSEGDLIFVVTVMGRNTTYRKVHGQLVRLEAQFRTVISGFKVEQVFLIELDGA